MTRKTSLLAAGAAIGRRAGLPGMLAILVLSLLAVGAATAQETAAPSVSDVSLFTAPASGDTYQRGDPIEVRVDFDRLVTITGTPRIRLTVGANTRAVGLSSTAGPLSSTSSLFFEYTVVKEDEDTDGISIAADAIRLNGGTIKAAADGTTDADLTHSALAADSGHKVDGSVNEVPSVTGVSFEGSPENGATYELGETIELKVVFDRFIKWTKGDDDISIQVALTIGGQTALATLDHGRGHGGGITDLHFDYEVQADDFDADGISIPANALRLNGGSLKAASDATLDADLAHAAVDDDATRKVDGDEVTAPAVSEVKFSGTPSSGDAYQAEETIKLQVWFDRLVTVSGSPYVELTVGSRTRQAAFHTHGVEVNGIGFQYTVQARDSDADGVSVAANAIRLNGGTITAVDGTTAAVLTHAAVAADSTRKVGDPTATPPGGGPAVNSVFFGSSPRSGDTYRRGETIDVRVLFTEHIRVTGRPSLALDIGGRTRAASFWGTHFGRTASFRYTVADADRDADGISIAADAISLGGGTITSSGGSTDAELTHAAVAVDSGRKVNGSQVSAPAVSGVSITSRPRGGTYARGESIVVEVRFSEPVTVTGSPRLALTVGTATRGAGFTRTSGSTLWFSYRVQEEDRDSDGIGIAAGALSPNGGTIKDSDKNDARLGLGSHAIANAAAHRVDADLVDTAAPAVTGVTLMSSPQDGSTFVRGEAVEIEVEFSETVTVTGSPRLTLTVGASDRSAVYASSRLRVVRFRYVVASDDSGALAVAPDALNLNGGSIVDLADNPAVLRLGSGRISLGQGASGVLRDDDPPTVRSVAFTSSPTDGDTYGRGDIVEAAVRFSEPVTVTGSPRLALAVGTATRGAAFHSADRHSVRFRYSVQEQDQAPNGVGVAAGGLSLNGGSIRDAAGNPANLSLAGASTPAGHNVDGGVASRTVPTLAAVTSQPRNGEVYQRGESVDVEVQFNKEVNVSGQPQLELIIGPPPASSAARAGRLAARASPRADTRAATFVAGAGERLRFRYVVQAG
ncbi:MAG: hypothetical protein OXC31_18070, partial [Spirochaetaceae bacterium]|nr:hypothetical protein [Spirochaetaceae bacterium]